MSRVYTGMRTIHEIHEEIERLSEERSELWHALSSEYDAAVRETSAGSTPSSTSSGTSIAPSARGCASAIADQIVARARVEERLERAA